MGFSKSNYRDKEAFLEEIECPICLDILDSPVLIQQWFGINFKFKVLQLFELLRNRTKKVYPAFVSIGSVYG